MKESKGNQFERNGHPSSGCGVHVCSLHTQWPQRDREVLETAGLCLVSEDEITGQGPLLC